MTLTAEARAEVVGEDAGEALLEKVRALAPSLTARAAEFEAARRIPADVIDQLRDIGVFRMYAPRSHGGLELDFPTTLEILTVLARADGAAGWTAMIGTGSLTFFSRLPRETLDTVFANGPDVIVCGSAAPAGTAQEVEGGYRVSGRWPFASGCQNADWLFSGCVVMRDGAPAPGRIEGAPLVRHITLPASQWRIEDTWHVEGLKGTGSHHIALDDVFVPAANVFDFGGKSCLDGPLYQSPLHLVPLMHGAPAIGIAEGAIDDLVALAGTGKRPLFATDSLKDSPLFQLELGRITADVRAARALQEAQARDHWRRALAAELAGGEALAEGAQTAVWVTTACIRAVDACYSLGGGSVVYDTSPLQRRLRDIHAASQHTAVQPRQYINAGAARLGHPVRHPLLG